MSVALPAPYAEPRAASTGRDERLAYLVVFAAAALAAGLGRAVVTTYLPLLLDKIRDAPGLIGTVMLVNAAAGFAVPLVVGLWSDRLRRERRGRRMAFVLGGSMLAGAGLAAVALGSGTSYLVLALAGAVVYVGLNAVTTAHRALVPESFEPSARAKATGAQELALLAGTLIGVAGGGMLTELAPWAPFALAAAAVPLLALPTVVRVRETFDAEVPERESRAATYYVHASLRPRVRALLAAQILWVLGYAALPAFFILFAERELGLAPSVASLLLGAFGVVTGLAILGAGRVRHTGRHLPVLSLGVALMGGGFLAIAFASELAFVFVALMAAAAGFGLISTLGFPLFSALIPAGEAGGYTALYFSVRAIASAVALPAAGWTIALSGNYRMLFVLGGAVTLAALIPLSRVGAGEQGEAKTARSIHVPARCWWLAWGAALAVVYSVTLGAAHVIGATSLHRLDEAVFRLLNRLGPAPEFVWDALNPHTRNYVLLAALAVSAAVVTRRARATAVLGLVTLSALLAWGVLEAVYAAYDRPRPEEVIDPSAIVLNGHTWGFIESFPSGHLAITTALAAATALVFPRLRLALWAYVVLVAFTRVLFGAHFPLDTLAGILIGYVSARAIYSLMVEVGLFERTGAAPRPCGCPRGPTPA